MEAALQHVYDTLRNSSTVTDEIAAANMFPLVAPIETAGDFLTFQLESSGKFTKDLVKEYDITINVFCNNLLEAAQKADIIEGVLSNNKFRLRSESTQYAEDYATAYISLVFNLKL